ncbi:uncharacterized protein (DUF2336 family) [Pararhizobium capsulatum DSM 1112]|uniref:Uncharacterized protein (DUF2336 family) n=1 Tax=Pararhizobium capsulatum DSM 1112 TaxID=1121113 RepID=A0ABU0BPB5_9HYPH|nr:DUF2336 domain-containing protein [Pararhizobium capsulatum]MDQ0319584.1 uncharacterized protein (DUF2336 family) [Pararhizobium capsulatum DSM 1112]
MATVTSFESLRHPRKSDLHQFAELFHPLFETSSDEARRQAAAALSRCPHVPATVALQIGSAPIGIAAIFLTRAPTIDDAVLLQIVQNQSTAHATAIARRDNLSVRLVDALVDRRQSAAAMPHVPLASDEPAAVEPPAEIAPQQQPVSQEAETTLIREEKLRNEIKALARKTQPRPQAPPRITVEPLDALNEALLVRFARLGEINLFASTLATALNSSSDLAERMLLDVSGLQLSMTLRALGMPDADLRVVLHAFYPDLDQRLGGTTRGDMLMSTLVPDLCRERLLGWLAVDRENDDDAQHQPYLAPERPADPRAQKPVNVGSQRSQRIDRQSARR